MSRGLLVCLSGIESSGKSSQLKLLTENAYRQGLRPVHLWTRPGYTRNLEAAKRLVRQLMSARAAGRSSGSSTAERVPRAYPRRGEGFLGEPSASMDARASPAEQIAECPSREFQIPLN